MPIVTIDAADVARLVSVSGKKVGDRPLLSPVLDDDNGKDSIDTVRRAVSTVRRTGVAHRRTPAADERHDGTVGT